MIVYLHSKEREVSNVQRVTNCILLDGNKVLLLQKPSKGWWVAPGGKMEQGESVKESVIREYKEETGLQIYDPAIKGIFTIVIEEEGNVISEWMLFTFVATAFKGEMLKESPEGQLQWIDIEKVLQLPMAPGDKFYFEHLLSQGEREPIIGTFHYTPDYQLVSYRLEPNPNGK